MFDLDGTLVDSRQDLSYCVNAVLVRERLEPLEDSVIQRFIGDGARALVERSLHAAGAPPDIDVEFALQFFLNEYRDHLLDHTYAYAGVVEALAAIHAAPAAPRMAVLTNKPVNPSRRICDALGLSCFLFANYAGNSFATKKPDPEGLLHLWKEAESLTQTEILPEEIVVIGDSEVDIRTARHAGVGSLGCTWGFAPQKMLAEHPDRLAHSPTEWPTLLLALS